MNLDSASFGNSKSKKIIHRLWRWFLAPSPQIKEQDQRRQAVLLSALLIAIVLLILVVETISLALYAEEYYIIDRLTFATAGVLAISYFISRTKYVRVAAVMVQPG